MVLFILINNNYIPIELLTFIFSISEPVDENQKKLLDAAYNGDEIQLKELLSKGTDIETRDYNFNGETALIYASTEGHLAILNILLDNQADINAQDHTGSTPLHLASFNGHLSIVETLVEQGAEINIQDKWGNSPLDLAKQYCELDIATYLQSHGGIAYNTHNIYRRRWSERGKSSP